MCRDDNCRFVTALDWVRDLRNLLNIIGINLQKIIEIIELIGFDGEITLKALATDYKSHELNQKWAHFFLASRPNLIFSITRVFIQVILYFTSSEFKIKIRSLD